MTAGGEWACRLRLKCSVWETTGLKWGVASAGCAAAGHLSSKGRLHVHARHIPEQHCLGHEAVHERRTTQQSS